MKNKLIATQKQITDFLLYTDPNGAVKVEVFLRDENLWLPQKKMAELFDVNVPAISKHLNNIYEEGELNKETTISILETVQQEGSRDVKRQMEFYNLDAIIAVGYRVNSKRATQFRIWATQILKEYIIKGFAMTMKDWVNKLDAFLQFNEKDILNDLDKVSHEVAIQLAETEYEKYRKDQDKKYVYDFDREVKKLSQGETPRRSISTKDGRKDE